jgi:hypothetical protein
MRGELAAVRAAIALTFLTAVRATDIAAIHSFIAAHTPTQHAAI